jgi:predicted MFS family arabinose efflux permease
MNRVLNVVAFAGFGSSLFVRSVDPVIPLIAGDLRVEVATAALLSTAFAIPYAFVQPVLGATADMFGKARMMNVCMLLLIGCSLMGALATSFPVLFASRVLAGIASGGIFPIALALVGDLVPVHQRQVAISRLLGAAMTGNLLGVSAAGVVGDLIGWRAVFVGTALAGVLVLVAQVIGLRGLPSQSTGRAGLRAVLPGYRAIFANPLAKYCFGTVLIEGIFLFGVFPHVAALLYAEGETRASIAGFVIAGFMVGGVLYTFAVGWLLGLVGERWLMLAGGILMGLGLLVVGLRTPWQVQFGAFFMMGIAFYMLHGTIHVYVTELAPQARAASTAVHSSFFFFGQSIGPIYYGLAFGWVHPLAALSVGAAAVMAVGVMCALMLRHTPPAEQEAKGPPAP